MSTPGESFIHVYVGHGLLIRHVWMPSNGLFDIWMPLMVSTAFICPVELTDV